MKLSEKDYFFYEWLILGKGMSEEEFSHLSSEEIKQLHNEWQSWLNK